jgi:hypothetical protein
LRGAEARVAMARVFGDVFGAVMARLSRAMMVDAVASRGDWKEQPGDLLESLLCRSL